jgi:O-antigen/teichoic acid export membrane protein
MQKALLKTSFIYSVTSFTQKGLLFLLLPFYTKYLQPDDYGVITVVLAMSYLWASFFSLGLDSAIIRFYYDKSTPRDEFKSLFGTLLLFIFLVSIVNYILLVTVFSFVIEFLLSGRIPFYPYVYIGLAVLIFQPLYNFSMAFLQVKKEVGKYTILSFFYFFVNVSVTILMVIVWEMSSVGYLLALLLSQAVSCIFGLILVRNDFVLAFNWSYVKKSLRYSYPFIPHNLMAQIGIDSDRFIINRNLSTAAAGVYHLGYVLSVPIEVVTNSINRAFNPMFLQNIESGDEGRKRIRESSLMVCFIYFIITVAIAIFSFEIVYLFFEERFLDSHKVIPLIAFGFLNAGFYFLFSSILFFDSTLTKYMPACTFLSTATGIGLDLILIPIVGLTGAAIGFFIGRFVLAAVAYYFSRRNHTIKWPLKTFATGYILSGIIVLTLVPITSYLKFNLMLIVGKIVVLAIFPFILSYLFWGRLSYFYQPLLAMLNLRRKTE